MPKEVSSKTGHPEAARRVIEAALAEEAACKVSGAKPSQYPDGIALIVALAGANGFSNVTLDRCAGVKSISRSVLYENIHPTWDFVDRLITTNALNLPADSRGAVEPSAKALLYERCGYFERTPENIRAQVDMVFAQERDYPTFGAFLKALMHANGMQSLNAGKEEIPSEILRQRMERKKSYASTIVQIAEDVEAPGDDFLRVIVEHNALGFREDHVDGYPAQNAQKLDKGQIDSFFRKAGPQRIHWRQDTLERRGREVIEAIEKEGGRITGVAGVVKLHRIGEACRLLLPHLPLEGEDDDPATIRSRMMKVNPQLTSLRHRVYTYLDGIRTLTPDKIDALLTVAMEETGITETQCELIKTRLSAEKRASQKSAFTDAMLRLGDLCLPIVSYLGTPNWTHLSRCTHKTGEARARLSESTVGGLANGSTPPSVYETMRELVHGFEYAYGEKCPGGSVADIRPAIDAMLEHTAYTYEQLFQTPEQAIADNLEKYFIFDEENFSYRLRNDRHLGLGELIVNLRTAVGVEMGQEEFSQAAGISRQILRGYECVGTVPDAKRFGDMLTAAGIGAEHPLHKTAMEMMEAYTEARNKMDHHTKRNYPKLLRSGQISMTTR